MGTPVFVAVYLAAAAQQGLVSAADLAAAGTRFLNVAFATGVLDATDNCAYNSYGPERVDTPQNRYHLCLERVVQCS